MSAPRSRYRRRAFWSLVWAILIFFTAQAATGVLLDYWWLEVRFPQAAAVLADASSRSRSPDIICLGSSRLGAAFRPAEITANVRRLTGDEGLEAFNACIEAGDTITAEFMLDQLLRQGARPAVVVVEVSPETLADRNAWMHLHVSRQLRWQDVPGLWLDAWRTRNLPRLAAGRVVPLHAYRRELCASARAAWPAAWTLRWGNRRKQPKPERDDLPFVDTQKVTGRSDKPLPPWEQRLIWLPMVRGWLKDYRLGGAALRALDRIVNRCQEEGIEVILVGVPVSTPHRQLYTPAIEAEFLACMNQLTERPGCRFLDWRDRFPDELFVDNHHLFREGALAFSRQFASEVLVRHYQPAAQATAVDTCPP
jgi:hypothetical protein